jgi:hypothetical protein
MNVSENRLTNWHGKINSTENTEVEDSCAESTLMHEPEEPVSDKPVDTRVDANTRYQQ